MANHKSAEKRARQTRVREARNRAHKSRVRTAISGLRQLLLKKDKAGALKVFPSVQSALAKLAKTGAASKQTASRKISRLAEQIARL